MELVNLQPSNSKSLQDVAAASGSYNINGNMTSTLMAVDDSYQVSTDIVQNYMADQEVLVQEQASMNNEYNTIEHEQTPTSNPLNFQNCYYELQQGPPKGDTPQQDSDFYSEWGALANGDSTALQNYNQSMTSSTQQIQQTTNQNTTNEQSILAIGNAITGFEAGFTRYIQG